MSKKQVSTWTCPRCAARYERRQEEKEKRCRCGRQMLATHSLVDDVVKRRLED